MAKTKAQLRSEIRAQPRGSAPEVAERDGRILDHLRAWPPLRRAGRIGVFLPLPYEPDLRPLLLYEGFVGHPLRKDYPKDREQPLVPYLTP